MNTVELLCHRYADEIAARAMILRCQLRVEHPAWTWDEIQRLALALATDDVLRRKRQALAS